MDFCESRIFGKRHRLKFKKGTYESKAILVYVHFDLWGLETVPTHGGSFYFLSVVNDFLGKFGYTY